MMCMHLKDLFQGLDRADAGNLRQKVNPVQVDCQSLYEKRAILWKQLVFVYKGSVVQRLSARRVVKKEATPKLSVVLF
jgi:hypothetical protein